MGESFGLGAHRQFVTLHGKAAPDEDEFRASVAARTLERVLDQFRVATAWRC